MKREYENRPLSQGDWVAIKQATEDGGNVDVELHHELVNLFEAVHKFTGAMKAKLLKKAAEDGFRGWDEASKAWLERCERLIFDHVGSLVTPGDDEAEIDLANLVMFHHFVRRHIEREERLDRALERDERGL